MLTLPGSSYFSLMRYSLCAFGGSLLLGGLVVLSWIEQDDGRHSFGHAGGKLFLNSIKSACPD